MNWGSGFSLEMFNNGNEARKEAAWEFYQYLMSADVQKTYFETSGWLMSNKTAMAEATNGDAILSRIIQELPYTKDKVYVPDAPRWHGNDWQKFYQEAMNPENDDIRKSLRDAQKFYLEKQENYTSTQ